MFVLYSVLFYSLKLIWAVSVNFEDDFMILISHMFAFFKRLISAKPECSRGGGGFWGWGGGRGGEEGFYCFLHS